MYAEKETMIKPGLFLIALLVLLIATLMYKAGELKGRDICIEDNHTTMIYIEKESDICPACPTCKVCDSHNPITKEVYINQTVEITKWLPCNESKDMEIIRQLKWCEKELRDRRNESILLEVIENINESLKTNSSALDKCLLDLCESSNRTKGCREGE